MADPTLEDLARNGGWAVDSDQDGLIFTRAAPTLGGRLIDGVPQARALVERGFAAVCSTCSHLRQALSLGAKVCGRDCGGPLAGREFPDYRGPFDGALQKTCFACGSEAEALVARPGWKWALGSCKKHADWIRRQREAP